MKIILKKKERDRDIESAKKETKKSSVAAIQLNLNTSYLEVL